MGDVPIIYELARTDYEEYSPHLFRHPALAPSQAEWGALCDGLLDVAARRACDKAAAQLDGKGTWVGMYEIIDEMLPMLEAQGWVRVRPVVRSYFGGCIIRKRDIEHDNADHFPEEYGRLTPAALALCDAHNLAVERQDWEAAGRTWDEPE